MLLVGESNWKWIQWLKNTVSFVSFRFEASVIWLFVDGKDTKRDQFSLFHYAWSIVVTFTFRSFTLTCLLYCRCTSMNTSFLHACTIKKRMDERMHYSPLPPVLMKVEEKKTRPNEQKKRLRRHYTSPCPRWDASHTTDAHVNWLPSCRALLSFFFFFFFSLFLPLFSLFHLTRGLKLDRNLAKCNVSITLKWKWVTYASRKYDFMALSLSHTLPALNLFTLSLPLSLFRYRIKYNNLILNESADLQ